MLLYLRVRLNWNVDLKWNIIFISLSLKRADVMIVPQFSPPKSAYSVSAFEERKERKGDGKKRCSSLVLLLLPKLYHLVTCFWEHFASLGSWAVSPTHTSFEEICGSPLPTSLYFKYTLVRFCFCFLNIDLTKQTNKNEFGTEFNEEEWILLTILSDPNCVPYPGGSPSVQCPFPWQQHRGSCLYTLSVLSFSVPPLPRCSRVERHAEHASGMRVYCLCPILWLIWLPLEPPWLSSTSLISSWGIARLIPWYPCTPECVLKGLSHPK